MTSRLPCREMFGEVRGSEIQELVERVTGGPCPCVQGNVCPLVGAKAALLLPEQWDPAPVSV